MPREPDTRQLNATIDEFGEIIERLQRAGSGGRQILAEFVHSHGGGASITLSDIVLVPASGTEQARMVHIHSVIPVATLPGL